MNFIKRKMYWRTQWKGGAVIALGWDVLRWPFMVAYKGFSNKTSGPLAVLIKL